MRRFHNVRGRIAGLAFSADGQTLAACVRGGQKVAFWNLATGAFRRWHPYADDAVTSIAFSPDGKLLAVGSAVGMVLPYHYPGENYDSEFHPAGFRSHNHVTAIAFGWTEDRSNCHIAMTAGNLLVSLMDDDLTDKTLPANDGESFSAVAFSPNGRFLAAINESTFTVQLWDVWASFHERTRTLDNEPRSVCFSGTGEVLAVAAASRVWFTDVPSLRTWNAGTHEGGRVTQVVGHPTRNLIASAGTDGTVRFWNADDATEARTFDWQMGAVTAVAFAPDGLTCAAGGDNGQVVVWDVDT